MTQIVPTTRAFRVHARHLDIHDAHVLHEPTFEAAAVAYVEHLHHLPAEQADISIIVREVDSGHEHCFRVDLESGETSSCG